MRKESDNPTIGLLICKTKDNERDSAGQSTGYRGGLLPIGSMQQRNIDHGGKYETQSEEQAKLLSAGIQYSLRVDTSKLSPDECAAAILKALF